MGAAIPWHRDGQPYDLVCLDIMMPHETGISFFTKLRHEKDYQQIPVIIISGVVETEKFNFHSYVSDDSILPPESFMEKPINIKNFIAKIEQLT